MRAALRRVRLAGRSILVLLGNGNTPARRQIYGKRSANPEARALLESANQAELLKSLSVSSKDQAMAMTSHLPIMRAPALLQYRDGLQFGVLGPPHRIKSYSTKAVFRPRTGNLFD
jgi:hypothetical protein